MLLVRCLDTSCSSIASGAPHPTSTPRLIEFVDARPKTVSGKIRRTELRARERARTPANG